MMTEGPEGFNWMKSLESPLIVTSHPNSEHPKEWLEALKVELVAVRVKPGIP